LQVPFTIIVNLFAFTLCCNFCKCQCCRGSLFIADDSSVPESHHGVMLHTAESIKNLHLPNYADADNENDFHPVAPESPKTPAIGGDHSNHSNNESEAIDIGFSHQSKDSEDHNGQHHQNNSSMHSNVSRQSNAEQKGNERTAISILQWNVFGQLGRYWKRYPLLATQIHELSPDIICIQEAVTVKWWRFGTVNMVKKIDPRYRGFHVSAYNVLHDYKKLCFQYSCGWRILNECQSCCNLYFLLPFWRHNFWKYSLRSNGCCRLLFNTFTSIIAQIGNAIIFRHNYQLFRAYIPLKAGNQKIALRALYIIKDDPKKSQADNSYGRRLSLTISAKKKNKQKKRKKLWVVSTHLTRSNEHKDGDEQDRKKADDEQKHNEDEEEDVEDAGKANQNQSNQSEDEDNEDALKQIQQIINWMNEAQRSICKADAIIICGDFNATPRSKVYQFMIENGYKSVVSENKGKEQWTYPTETWRFPRNGEEETEEELRQITKDYIWIKEIDHKVIVDSVQLVGRHYVDYEHRGEPIKIYPSDHLGIYCKLLV